MKLFDVIIFSLAVVLFIIGVHQTIMVGFSYSYWLFMLCTGLLLWYNYRKNSRKQREEQEVQKKRRRKDP